MPLQETSGNVTTDAYGGGKAVVPTYIEDVFSTYLYTGNDAYQAINNGIDLANKGGLVWSKSRATAGGQFFYDSVRGASTGSAKSLTSNTTAAQVTTYPNSMNFTSSGFELNSNANSPGNLNASGETAVSWTFRKQPKFFDVVTWTGNGASSRTFTHNLKAYPNCAIIKRTDSTSDWWVWHAYASNYLQLNSTAAANSTGVYSGGSPTDFTIWDTFGVSANVNGGTYVAYLFADNAGGFGLTGTDNVISCGSFTTNASGDFSVNLGYEPQFMLVKTVGIAQNWDMRDSMRGWSYSQGMALYPNTSGAESDEGGVPSSYWVPTATGSEGKAYFSASQTYIYIAIRRGPMKVPTSGTSVFSPVTRTGTGTTTSITGVGFPPDAALYDRRGGLSAIARINDKLRGAPSYLGTASTAAEVSATQTISAFGQDGVTLGTSSLSSYPNNSGESYINWFFKRAPSFFDEVCYTGTGSATTVTHNLGVAPQLIIAKSRSGAFNWTVYSSTLGNSYPLFLNGNSDGTTNYGALMWGSTAPTSTQFPVGTYTGTNSNGQTYVAYLFATCAGVSKVGSYTGNGSTQTINCGFTGGARFVLIKRTDAAGDWYVYDTARGMTTLTDPYLLLNSTAAESATLGSVTTVSTGFALNASILAAINTNAASYIFFAVA